jgi:1-aminocyclopropane-1-carboxylate deaminase
MMQILILFIEKDYFPKNSKILAFHTGGLQGNEGVNFQLNKKNKTILDFSK